MLHSPWRAVLVLGIAQIIAWGALIYPFVLTLPAIASERGWPLSLAMAGFSLALLVAGLASPRIGGLIDRFGGHRVMPFGSLLGAAGLAALAIADHPGLYLATWILIGLAMAANLYDPAFATLGRIFGAAARSPITVVTLAGGFASTVSWPATHMMMNGIGWRGAYFVHAALLCFISAPLLALALPRARADVKSGNPGMGRSSRLYFVDAPPSGQTFVLVAVALAAFAFINTAASAHLLAIFSRAGIDATTVVMIGMVFGPAQVAARLLEFLLGGNVHPLSMAQFAVAIVLAGFAVLALAGVSPASAAVFALLFGAGNGLVTIARGTVPLALFGAVGYGKLVGRLAAPQLSMQAAAPFLMAVMIEGLSGAGALAVMACFAAVSLGCFMAVRPPLR